MQDFCLVNRRPPATRPGVDGVRLGCGQLSLPCLVMAQGQVRQLGCSSSSLPAFSLLLPLPGEARKAACKQILGLARAEMAACGRGLRRAVGASPHPALRRAHSDARGRLKPEYDAVVIGAGKVGWAGAEGLKGSPAQKALASLYSGTSWPGVGMRAGAGVESPPVCEQMPGFWGWLCC